MKGSQKGWELGEVWGWVFGVGRWEWGFHDVILGVLGILKKKNSAYEKKKLVGLLDLLRSPLREICSFLFFRFINFFVWLC